MDSKNIPATNSKSGVDLMEALAGLSGQLNGRDVLSLKYERVRPAAFAPRYATDGAACFDLFADDAATVGAGQRSIVGTGVAFEVPNTHVMLVFSRSGHGVSGIRLGNGVGVIDPDYRGEVSVIIVNDGVTDFQIKAGDRIAQAMLVPIPLAALVEVDKLAPTRRGSGGFGSTGH